MSGTSQAGATGPQGAAGADGTTSHSGTAILDFGATPASEASVDVSGQSGIGLASRIRVWFSGSAMGDNDIGSHLQAGAMTMLVPGSIIAGVGFSIYATIRTGLATGQFRISWIWSA